MGNTPDELEHRTARLERAVFGDDDSSEGLSARVKITEMHTIEIRENFKRLNWLLITGIVVGLLNLVLNRAPSKTWLTTQEVAKRENVTDRTVINYIESQMIDPPPARDGKAWRIAENYRIVPNDSELCGSAQN